MLKKITVLLLALTISLSTLVFADPDPEPFGMIAPPIDVEQEK